MGFYDAHGDSFPNRYDLAEDSFLLAPSSATVERVFSFLRDKFDKKSFASLIDYICTFLMLKSNGREIVPRDLYLRLCSYFVHLDKFYL